MGYEEEKEALINATLDFKFELERLRAARVHEESSAFASFLERTEKVFINANEALRADKEVALLVVSVDGSALEYASDELKNDPELVIEAVRNFPDAFLYASPGLRGDKEMVLLAARIAGDPSIFDCCAAEALRQDVSEREFLKALGSSLACGGENVPIWTVRLSDQRHWVCCTAALLSGYESTFFLNMEATMNDLGVALRLRLPRKMQVFDRVVVVLEGGSEPVSPWSWNVPLVEFL